MHARLCLHASSISLPMGEISATRFRSGIPRCASYLEQPIAVSASKVTVRVQHPFDELLGDLQKDCCDVDSASFSQMSEILARYFRGGNDP